jgi:hypothetical protein
VIDNWSQPKAVGDFLGATETRETITLEAGREYLLTLEFSKAKESPLAVVSNGGLEEGDEISHSLLNRPRGNSIGFR